MKKFIITESERNRILSLHKSYGRIIMEQSGSVKLPDGHYFADGSGFVYEIKDFSGKKTGYSVESTVGVRGFVQNDPMIIIGGNPISKTWKEGGKVSFKDSGWAGTSDPLTPVITPNSLITNSIPKIIIDSPAPKIELEGGKGNFVVGNKLYMLDVSSVYSGNFYDELGTESVDSLVESLKSDELKLQYPNSYNFLSSNAKLGTQYISLFPDIIYINKNGTPQIFKLN